MYNSVGNLVWQADLDIYGKVRTLSKGNINDCPFRYQGQYHDTEVELHYNRFRYYSPDSGMYISQDPIGLEGGMPNLYSYIGDINSYTDPFGLDRFPSWMNTRRGYQRHHILPYSLRNHSLFQKSEMDINASRNMIYLPVADGINPNPNKSLHRGWNSVHADYNNALIQQLDDLEALATAENWDKNRIQSEIVQLQQQSRTGLNDGSIKCH